MAYRVVVRSETPDEVGSCWICRQRRRGIIRAEYGRKSRQPTVVRCCQNCARRFAIALLRQVKIAAKYSATPAELEE